MENYFCTTAAKKVPVILSRFINILNLITGLYFDMQPNQSDIGLIPEDQIKTVRYFTAKLFYRMNI